MFKDMEKVSIKMDLTGHGVALQLLNLLQVARRLLIPLRSSNVTRANSTFEIEFNVSRFMIITIKRKNNVLYNQLIMRLL